MDITELWNLLIVYPLQGVLTALAFIPGVGGGLAIILMTLIVKTLLLPLSLKQTNSMKAMQAIQPEIAEIRRKYKDREQVTQETMKLYKERGINPVAGCLPMLPTMVILFGLYWALQNLSQTVPEFQQPFLWVPRLDQPDVIQVGDFPLPGLLPIGMAVTQYFSSKMMTMPTSDPQQQMMNRMMVIIFPGMMLFWGVTFPAGLVLYWFISNVFEMVRLYFTMGPRSLQGNAPAPAAEPEPSAPASRVVSSGDTASSGGRSDGRPARSRQKRGKRSGRR